MKYAFILISFLLFCSSAYADISDYVSPRAAFFGFILIVFLIYFYIKDKISEKEELNTKARIKIEEEQYESQKKIYETAWDDYHSKNYNTAKISFARINNYKLIRSSNYGLGLINLNSKSKDYDLAIKHFKFASEKGHKDATFELAKLQMKGKFKSDSDYMKLSRNLGNLDAQRDWGHAKDYIRMMWMILQAEEPEDWVIATGRTTSVRDFVRMCFAHVGVQLEFRGKGSEEKGYVKSSSNPDYYLEPGKEVVSVDEKYYRPTEVDLLVGDATKAKEKLGWVPKYDLPALVEDMMSSDLKLMGKQQYLKDGGYRIKNYFE